MADKTQFLEGVDSDAIVCSRVDRNRGDCILCYGWVKNGSGRIRIQSSSNVWYYEGTIQYKRFTFP